MTTHAGPGPDGMADYPRRVPRETTGDVGLVPAAPDWAVAVFEDHLPLIQEFAALLAGRGVERGLLGPSEVPRIWERHLLNCAAIADLIPPGSKVGDVGSGAGLPGMVLAVVRPDLEVTLVEPLLRRAAFLTECVQELELVNATVERSRAEDLGRLRPARMDVVTARAVAPLERLVGWCLPLLRPGGALLAIKGAAAAEELASASAQLRRVGAGRSEILRVGPAGQQPTTVVRVLRRGRGASRAGSDT